MKNLSNSTNSSLDKSRLFHLFLTSAGVFKRVVEKKSKPNRLVIKHSTFRIAIKGAQAGSSGQKKEQGERQGDKRVVGKSQDFMLMSLLQPRGTSGTRRCKESESGWWGNQDFMLMKLLYHSKLIDCGVEPQPMRLAIKILKQIARGCKWHRGEWDIKGVARGQKRETSCW